MSKSRDAFRTISEVADWLGAQPHVLRFWESKFPQVKPVKRAGGRRYYRPADMLLLGGIKHLLHEEGLTIKGARKSLRDKGVKYVASLSPPLDEDIDNSEIEADLDAKSAEVIPEVPIEVEAAPPPTAEIVPLKQSPKPTPEVEREVKAPIQAEVPAQEEAPIQADVQADTEVEIEAQAEPQPQETQIADTGAPEPETETGTETAPEDDMVSEDAGDDAFFQARTDTAEEPAEPEAVQAEAEAHITDDPAPESPIEDIAAQAAPDAPQAIAPSEGETPAATFATAALGSDTKAPPLDAAPAPFPVMGIEHDLTDDPDLPLSIVNSIITLRRRRAIWDNRTKVRPILAQLEAKVAQMQSTSQR